jgi:urease accessory protein
MMIRRLPVVLILALAATPALAHPAIDHVMSFAAGFAHPLGGADHILAMVAVGLWAALKGGRALWLWPAAFVLTMLLGGALGTAGMPLPLVEPAIAASIMVLGLLVAMAADLPLWTGAAIIGLFALFHGHAHGAEMPQSGQALLYALGFASATLALHGVGLLIGVASRSRLWHLGVRAAGAVLVAAGAVLLAG